MAYKDSLKEAEKKNRQKKVTVYTTQKINEIMESQNSGYEPDMTPFFENDFDFRDANVPFEMTDWEKEEYIKCSVDPEYFIANYVKFQTDYGYKTVALREYQKRMVHLMGDEVWDDKIQTFVPESRYNIIMCSRQMGKCLDADSDVCIREKLDFSRLTFKDWFRKKISKLKSKFYELL